MAGIQGLQKQNVSLTLGKGLDTKTDPKQVIAGSLLELKNGRFRTPMRLEKRYGYLKRNQAIEGGGTLSSARALASFKSELLQFTETDLYSYAESNQRWTAQGQEISLITSLKPVVRNTYIQTTPEIAYHSSGLSVSTWEDSRGGSYYSVVDTVTNQIIVEDTLLAADYKRPKPMTNGQYIVIFAVDSTNNNIVYAALSTLDPSAALSFDDYVTDVPSASSEQNYDVCKISNRLFVAYNSSAATTIGLRSIDQLLNLSNTRSVGSSGASVSINVCGDSSDNVWVGYYNGTAVSVLIRDFDLSATAVLAPTVLETVANILGLTGKVTGTTGTYYYQQSASNSYDNLIRTNTMTLTGTAGTAAVFIRSVGLFSKQFSFGSKTYMLAAYQSTLQSTYFLIDTDAKIVAKVLYGNAGGLLANNLFGTTQLSEVSSISDDSVTMAIMQKNLVETLSGAVYTQTGISALTIEFNTLNSFLRAEAANNLHISGGYLSMYDGVSVVEHNFHLYPENVAVAAGTFTGNVTNGQPTVTNIPTTSGLKVGMVITGTGVAGLSILSIDSATQITMSGNGSATNANVTLTITGAVADGTYQYFVVEEWMDNYGNMHQSSPSPAVTFVVSGGPKANRVAIPTLRLTSKQSPRAAVNFALYRQSVAQPTPYRVFASTVPSLNSTTTDFIYIYDTLADASISGNQLLYTYGGVIENVAAPAPALVFNYKNRVIVVPSENRTSFQYSKANLEGQPIAFTDSFTQNIDPTGGDISAGIQMDDKMLLFKESYVMYTTGDGPTDTGQANDFAPAQIITSDTGCSNPRSLVFMPLGVMFKSPKGIYMITRGLQVQYIGAPVERYNDLTITSAILVPKVNEVRFLTLEGPTLVYDYFMDQWGTDEEIAGVDATVYQNTFTYATADGIVNKETPGTFTDNGQFIPLGLTTGWLSGAGLQAYQRVFDMYLLGEYKSPHQLKVTFAYDFNPNPFQFTYVQAGVLLDVPPYGEEYVYGAEPVYGGVYPTYEFEFSLVKQKCSAIQISIEDIQTENFGEGYNISALGFQAGAKSGMNKLKASRQV